MVLIYDVKIWVGYKVHTIVMLGLWILHKKWILVYEYSKFPIMMYCGIVCTYAFSQIKSL